MRPGRTPEELFDLVATYEAFGRHRTGSPVDHATAEWFTDELRSFGLTVRAESVPFRGWEADATVEIGGAAIECLAVPYEWEGSIDTTNVAIIDLDAGLGGDISVIVEPVRQARAAGFDAVVCATRHPSGLLRAINRPLGAEATNVPVFLVAGDQLAVLQSSVVRVRASARTVDATTTNLIADNGTTQPARTQPRLMVTTPLTGWFTCAGERGTGVAVLLDVVTRLVDDVALLVVATGGHELGCFGAHEWVADRMNGTATPAPAIGSILHIGASVAVDSAVSERRQLIETRVAMTSVSDAQSHAMRDALAAIGLKLTASATTWIGEAEAWKDLAVPMLSLSGAGLHFHTPEDHAVDVTSPASLARVAQAFTDAALALIATTN